MSRRENSVLNRHARQMVYSVYCFIKNNAELSMAKNMMEVYKQTAEATNTSVATVRRIVRLAIDSEFLVFKTPGKKRPREHPVTDVDSLDQGVIKRCIHNYHLANKEMPTVEKLRQKFREDINFQGSERSLRRIIKMLGFKWRKTENNRKILIEKSNIRFQRITYLQKMKKNREEGRSIIYTDESYVESSHLSSLACSDGSAKGQRIVIVHAGTETCFVPNALLTFKAVTKSGNHHDNMSYENYEKWLRTQLIPNIPPKSILVLDDVSYHNKQCDPAPTSNARKSEMLGWLKEKDIEHDERMLKPQLYNLIKINKDKHNKFNIDKIMAEHGHDVVRLPPHHPDLNPIEMAWAAIKSYVGSKNVAWNISSVTDLIKEKIDLMGVTEWAQLCHKVKEIENEYIKNDHIVDEITEEFIIRADDDDSESNSEDEIDDDEELYLHQRSF